MKNTIHYAIILVIAAVAGSVDVRANEVELADSVAQEEITLQDRLEMPLELTAEDFITKVYGIVSPDCNREELNAGTSKLLDLIPAEDEYGLWLESVDGYSVSYYGMTPAVSARAVVDGRDNVATFGFFFLFPYEADTRDVANQRQMDFCGSLLQEMTDIGLILGLDSTTNEYFDVSGDYKGNFVEVHLREENADNGSGRYVLTLNVEPHGFTPSDYLTAK